MPVIEEKSSSSIRDDSSTSTNVSILINDFHLSFQQILFHLKMKSTFLPLVIKSYKKLFKLIRHRLFLIQFDYQSKNLVDYYGLN
jgi:hypothetical protein